MLQRRLRAIDKREVAFHLSYQGAHFPDVVAQGLRIIGAGGTQLADLRIFRGASSVRLRTGSLRRRIRSLLNGAYWNNETEEHEYDCSFQ